MKTSLLTVILLNLLSSCDLKNKETLQPESVEKFDIKRIYLNLPEAGIFNLIGDTVQTFKTTKLHTAPNIEVDLSAIKNNTDPDLKDKPLRYIAIGGSLTAGVRDGGYFNDGMLTSYPNLIARQMRLTEFRQPLFSRREYNGFGLKLPTTDNPTGGPITKFVAVKNNLAINAEKDGEVVLSKFTGEIDNWAIPYITTYGLARSADDKSIQEIRKFAPYLARITDEGNASIREKLKNNKFDFFTFQIGLDDIVNYAVL